MIKNARDLTSREEREFRTLYAKYFSESCICSKVQKTNFLESLINTARNQRYVTAMIRKIEDGSREGFVSFDDQEENVTGFLVGYIGEAEGDISHLFVDARCPIGRRIQSLELYKAFSLEASKRGATKILASSDIGDEALNDTLHSLGFSLLEKSQDENKYGKQII